MSAASLQLLCSLSFAPRRIICFVKPVIQRYSRIHILIHCSFLFSRTWRSTHGVLTRTPSAQLDNLQQNSSGRSTPSTPYELNRENRQRHTSDGSDTVSTRHSLPQHLSSPPRCKDTTLNIVHNLSKLLQHNIKYCILNNASLSQLNLSTFSIKIRHKARTQKRANV